MGPMQSTRNHTRRGPLELIPYPTMMMFTRILLRRGFVIMPYCHRCSILTAQALRENDLPFHPNLRSLRDSADKGCEFCLVCWSAFKRDAAKHVDGLLRGESPFAEGSEWTPAIWLNGNQFGHPTSGDTIAVSCGRRGPKSDFWPEVNPETIEAVLEVYEEPGARSRYNIRGRRSTPYQDPELYVSLIKQWLDTCRTRHPHCPRARGSNDMPTRVVYVGEAAPGAQPRLMATAEHGISEPYAALSYCWGPDTADVPRLTDDTYASFAQGIHESTLSRSHRDMLSLARALGIKYVWIDALCIIQFNTADWERESKRMAVVYGNAALTVIAGRSADSKQGFIANDSEQHGIFCRLPKSAPEESTIMVGLRRSHSIGPTSTRAWCFQERLLSQRAVIFGVDQVRFSCRAGAVYEDGMKTTEVTGSTLLAPSPKPPRDAQRKRHEALREWYGLLFPYTRCRLADPHDVFAALSAMAQRAAAVLESRYLAGIWECDLVRGLMWRPTYHLAPNRRPTTRPEPTPLTGPCRRVARAPSWSWVSVQGQVSQQSFMPPNVALYEDRSNLRIRPSLDPDTWSEDSECGVDKLHMPACELRFTGCVAGARVLEESPKLRYTGLRKSMGKPVKASAPSRYGVLLVGTAAPSGGLDSAELLGHVAALGCFDVQEERVGVRHVHCLQVTPKHGLMLRRNADGSYNRLGWFSPEQDEWCSSQGETDVRLR